MANFLPPLLSMSMRLASLGSYRFPVLPLPALACFIMHSFACCACFYFVPCVGCTRLALRLFSSLLGRVVLLRLRVGNCGPFPVLWQAFGFHGLETLENLDTPFGFLRVVLVSRRDTFISEAVLGFHSWLPVFESTVQAFKQCESD